LKNGGVRFCECLSDVVTDRTISGLEFSGAVDVMNRKCIALVMNKEYIARS